MDKHMNQMNKNINRQIDIKIEEQIDTSILPVFQARTTNPSVKSKLQTDKQTDRWTNIWMDRWTNIWIDR